MAFFIAKKGESEMRRGTTPKLKLKLKGLSDLDVLKDVYVTLAQGNSKLTKGKDNVIIDSENEMLIVQLLEEETMVLKAAPIFIQVRATTDDGNVIASNIREIVVQDILYEEEIANGMLPSNKPIEPPNEDSDTDKGETPNEDEASPTESEEGGLEDANTDNSTD